MAVNEASRIHGERIRKTRTGLGMTQQELAQIFGVWRETISRIETGRYNIIRRYPKYAILNERMRIWAEMNKGGKKKKYVNSSIKVHSLYEVENPLPYLSSRRRYWEAVQERKKQEKQLKGEKHGGTDAE